MLKKQKTDTSSNLSSVARRLQAMAEPEIRSYISSVKAQYRQYALPLEEGRKVIDAAMGEQTLTAVLYEMRQVTSSGGRCLAHP